MVRFTVLASGSRGNSTVITGGNTKILVDAGLSCRELFRRMQQVGEVPEALNAILITHEHQDHVGGVAVTARKLGIPVFFTEATHREWMRSLAPRRQMTYSQWVEQRRKQVDESGEAGNGDIADSAIREDLPVQEAAKVAKRSADPASIPAVEYFQAGVSFSIGDIAVSPFTIPHDAADPVGFVFQVEGIRIAVTTDLGYVSPNVKAQLKKLDLLMLESNHDLEMLRDGPYPWQVKQRVLSRVGHLSNDATAEFLENDYDGHASHIVLAHLSESNNLPDLAKVSAERALHGHGSLLANKLLLAAQHEPLSPIYF